MRLHDPFLTIEAQDQRRRHWQGYLFPVWRFVVHLAFQFLHRANKPPHHTAIWLAGNGNELFPAPAAGIMPAAPLPLMDMQPPHLNGRCGKQTEAPLDRYTHSGKP